MTPVTYRRAHDLTDAAALNLTRAWANEAGWDGHKEVW